MTRIIIPQRRIWTRQPQQVVGIDWSNPITRGLVSAIFGGLEYDVAARAFTVRSGVSTSVDRLGKYAKLNGSAYIRQGATVGNVGLFAGSGSAWSSVVMARQDAVGSTGTFVAKAGGTSTSRTFQVYKTDISTQTPGVYIRGALTETNFGFDDTKFHQYTTVWDGSSAKLYVDDKSISCAVGSAAEEAEAICYGARTSGAGALLTGDIAYGFIFNRAITEDEHASLLRKPWQIFKQRDRRTIIDLGAGGLSSVYADSALSYYIRSMLSSDGGIQYAIRNAIYKDDVVGYYLRSAIAQNNEIGYVLRAAIAQNDAEAYKIRGLIQADDAEAYNVRGLVQTSDSEAYKIRGQMQADALASYEIQSSTSVASSNVVNYSVRGSVSASASLSYSVRGAVQKDVASTYSVRSSVSRDGASNYAISGAASSVYSDSTANYSVDGVVPSGPSAESIAAAVLAALQGTTIPVDTKKMNGSTIYGNGTSGDKWRGNV